MNRGPTAAERAETAFRKAFNSVPAVVARAPGRVNLLGEHVDYNDGLVLPIAIDRDVVVCARSCSDRALHVTSLEQGQSHRIPLGTSAAGWLAYVAGVATLLHLQRGADIIIASDVPQGAGLSSSAALEAALALALLALEGRAMQPEHIARLCQQAEREYANVQCGIMDQYAVLLARAGHALLLDCRSLEYDHVPLPAHTRFVLADSGAQRQLAASNYNVRVHECSQAARLLGVNSLREVDNVAAADGLPEPLNRRVRHVVGETERTRRMAAALRAGDAELCGALMNESHKSLRRDYEVSSAALDALVERSRAVPGVLGSRLTGAGFGGYTISLTTPLALPRLRSEVPGAFASGAVDGGSCVSPVR